MNPIEVFALLVIAAVTLCICACLRISRRKVRRAENMMRCLESAIRADATPLRAG